MSPISVHDLGSYLREQRQSAQLSLRQLSDLAGVSNPYLSQIERGLKKPSAEILQQLARGLRVSAESLYVRAGILDESRDAPPAGPGVLEAVAADPLLTGRQRAALVDIYESFVSAKIADTKGVPGGSPPSSATRRGSSAKRADPTVKRTSQTTHHDRKEKAR